MAESLKSLLKPEEIRALCQRSDAMGAWAVASTCLGIAVVFAMLALWPHPVMFLLAVVVLGAQQLRLAVLSHEAAHRSLFKTRQLNEAFADWICARPIWTDVARYRAHHMQHHAHTGTERDPDMALIEPFPTSRLSLARKLLRDASGLTGLRRILGLFLMDLGVLQYHVAGVVQRLPPSSLTQKLRSLTRHFGPVLLSNLALAGILASTGGLWLYSAWLLAYLTSFSVFLRIRSIAEHACMPGGADMFSNTRTTRAGWLARLCVAPLNVNYHQEHHLMASVPWFALPRLHALLQTRRSGVAVPGYWQVLQQASSD